MTPDPYTASGGPGDPQSWNRYAYTRGDPVNRIDARGLDDCTPSEGVDFCVTGSDDGDDGSDVGGGSDTGGGDYWGNSFNYYSGPTQTVGNYNTVFGTINFTGAQFYIHAAELGLAGKTSFSAGCENGLAKLGANVTPQALAAAAPGLNVANGTTSTTLIGAAYGNAAIGNAAQVQYNLQYAFYLGNYGLANLNIAEMFMLSLGLTAWTPFGGGTMYINPYWMNPSYTNVNQDMALVMHELLHEVFGLDDTDIQKALLGKAGGPTENITQWLLTNCIN
jgi:hypothetical protein